MSKMGLFWCFKTGIFHVQLEKDSLINIFRILTQREQVILEEKLLFSSCTLRCECFTQAFKNSYLLLSRLSPIPEAKKKSVLFVFFFFWESPFQTYCEISMSIWIHVCVCDLVIHMIWSWLQMPLPKLICLIGLKEINYWHNKPH